MHVIDVMPNQRHLQRHSKNPDAKWHSKQEITFQTSIHDTLVPLDVYIQLRNNQKTPTLTSISF